MSARLLSIAARLALVLCLFSVSIYFVSKPFLGDDYENLQRSLAVTQVVDRGPVTIDGFEWTLHSMKAYTQLVDEEGAKVNLEVPAGATIIVVEATVKADSTVLVDGDGYSCNAVLTDDQGNKWAEKSAYRFPLPTSCSDNDRPAKRNVPFKVAKLFVVPKSAVPGLLGIIVPPETRTEYRTLIRA
ncbi:hypothetical protein [Kribbella deserti]|uniref:Uncharacterized protein n=1 Tax=Kribbella deserti TaxID=1926257 RepID=A0ABV6QTQ7_9ACTN